MAKIMAGIVLYNAEIERLKKEVNSVLPQVDLICLYDNGSSNIEKIEEAIGSNDKITILKSPENNGIGTASNRICCFAESNGYEWVLLLDHDTICPDGLIDTYSKHLKNSDVGIICPNVLDREIAHNKYISAGQEETEFIDRCIQSASLVRISAWKECDGFNEWMFIDFVDFDFCKRMEVNGYKILRCRTVTVDHQLGKREKTWYANIFTKLYNQTGIVAFKYLTYKNVFSEARVYYCTRNNIAYIKCFASSIDKNKEWKDFFARIFTRILRSKNRTMIIKETLRGAYDGVKSNIKPYKN